MNVSQITRLASYNANAIKKAGTLAPFVTAPELTAWADEGNRKLEFKLRQTNANYFEKTVQSTSSTAVVYEGVSYTPSTSLPLAVGANTLTLPPDFQELRYIKVITSGYTGTVLDRMDHTDTTFQQLLKDTTNRGAGTAMLWDIYGARTFVWVPRLSAALDIEIGYIARQKRLATYSTGTLAVTDATTAVAGTTTSWLVAARYFDVAQLDLMTGTSASATLPVPEPTWVYDGANLHKVASITDATNLVIAADKVGTLAAGTGYILASVPTVPEEYHYFIADYVTMKILAKAGDPQMARALIHWPDNIADMLTTAGRRQSGDVETVEDWDPDA